MRKTRMKEILRKRGIELFGAIRLADCKITKKYLLDKAELDMNSTVVVMLLPYRSEIKPKNLSVYASVQDYHKLVNLLRTELKEHLNNRHRGAKIEVFADHSPIDEVNASCLAGLGFIGDNGLLINEKYSSFVFVCELITSLSASELGLELVSEPKITECKHCGACARACPSNCMDARDPRPKSECLSAITQKKGELSEAESALMLKHGSIWGCDICQNACPFTKNASFTPIEFFKQGIISELTSELVNNMSDEEFMSRPFSWRGRDVILRNTRIFECETRSFAMRNSE